MKSTTKTCSAYSFLKTKRLYNMTSNKVYMYSKRLHGLCLISSKINKWSGLHVVQKASMLYRDLPAFKINRNLLIIVLVPVKPVLSCMMHVGSSDLCQKTGPDWCHAYFH